MDQKCKFTDLCICQGKHPKFQTVTELPGVDILQNILSQIVSDRTQVETQLANVLEAKLITHLSVNRKKLDKAILGGS